MKISFALPIAIFLATFIAFFPSLRAPFLTLGDPAGYGWAQLSGMLFSYQPNGLYQPVTWASYAVDNFLSGPNPFGFHLHSLLLHCVNSVLVYFLIQKILEPTYSRSKPADSVPAWSAALGTLVFSLHPLRVEPVAWVSYRAYLLAGLFTLLSVLAYLKAQTEDRRAKMWLALSIGTFALSLLANCAALTLPLFLFFLDAYPLDRLKKVRDLMLEKSAFLWKEKLPYLLLSFSAAAVWLNGKYLMGMDIQLPRQGAAWLLAAPVYAAAWFAAKSLWPAHLVPIHPQPPHFHPLAFSSLAAAATVLASGSFLWACRRRWPAAIYGWAAILLLFLSSHSLNLPDILPQTQLASDSWTYLPAIALSIMLAGLTAYLSVRRPFRSRIFQAVLCFFIFVPASVLSYRQAERWRTPQGLLAENLRREPDCYVCHVLSADALRKDGNIPESQDHERQALDILINSLDPNGFKKHDALTALANGNQFLGTDPWRARNYFEIAIRIDPSLAVAHFSLGLALFKLGQMDKAIKATAQAAVLMPGWVEAHNNLGYFLQSRGRYKAAVEEYSKALQLNPNDQLAKNNMNAALRLLQR